MNERLKQLRKELDLTQREFAERIGTKQNTIATYEMGRNNPSDPIIRSICREFCVNEDWLRNGTGGKQNMFRSDLRDELDLIADKYDLSKKEKLLIEAFMRARKEDRDVVLRIFQSAVDAMNAGEDPEEKGLAAAEAAYEQAFGIQSEPGSPASSTTGDTLIG